MDHIILLGNLYLLQDKDIKITETSGIVRIRINYYVLYNKTKRTC